jgi:hypothetical protein
MLLECPLCGTRIDSQELSAIRQKSGGFDCPQCHQLLTISQPYALARRTAAFGLAVVALLVLGVRSPVWLLIGSVLSWPLTQLLVNACCARRFPLSLKPRVRRTRSETSSLSLFDHQRK